MKRETFEKVADYAGQAADLGRSVIKGSKFAMKAFLTASLAVGAVDGLQAGLRSGKCNFPTENLGSIKVVTAADALGSKVQIGTGAVLVPTIVTGAVTSLVTGFGKRLAFGGGDGQCAPSAPANNRSPEDLLNDMEKKIEDSRRQRNGGNVANPSPTTLPGNTKSNSHPEFNMGS